MRRILLTTTATFFSCLVIGQIEFDKEQLQNPKKFGDEIRAHFTELEIQLFDTTKTRDEEGNRIFQLRNGLRSSEYINGKEWQLLKDSAEILSIDVVFSKYPIRKDGYHMNMPLLFNRLKNLFEIDEELNRNYFDWNIVLQTNCKSDEQVNTMFHGVVIHYLLPSDEIDYATTIPEESPDNIEDQDSEEARLDKIEKITSSDKIPDSLVNILENRTVEEKEEIIADYYLSKMEDRVPEITPEYLTKKREEVENFIFSFGNSKGTDVIEVVFNRNPQWKNCLVVSDWTGSMYPYGGKVMEWHIDNFDKSPINHITLFNDGDRKTEKKIGETEGIYHVNADNISNVMNLYRYVMTKGGGGDGPENDIEGILTAIEHFEGDFDEVILIADNNSCVRDMSLIENISIPVHVIICGYRKQWGVNPQYLELAFKTGGSIHTIEEDLYDIDAGLDKDEIVIKDANIIIGKAPCFGSWLEASMFDKTVYTKLRTAKKNRKFATNLDISGQEHKRVGQGVCRLKKLKTLNISHNEIKSLPSGLQRLKELKTFIGSHNQFEEVPYSLTRIKYIIKIDLSHNKIREVPKELFRLMYLEHLDLSFNQIQELPYMSLLKKLKILNLSNNQIQFIPKDITKLKKLEQLDLSNNNLTVLPSKIGKLRNLEILDLSNNKLEKIPLRLAGCRRLKVLILTGNNLDKKDLKRLAYYLKDCKIII